MNDIKINKTDFSNLFPSFENDPRIAEQERRKRVPFHAGNGSFGTETFAPLFSNDVDDDDCGHLSICQRSRVKHHMIMRIRVRHALFWLNFFSSESDYW